MAQKAKDLVQPDKMTSLSDTGYYNKKGNCPNGFRRYLKVRPGGTIMAIEVPSLRKPKPNIGQRERIIPLQMELLLFGHTVHLRWSWMALISLKRCFLKARQAPAILTISKERFIYQYLDTLRFLHFRLDLVGECRFHFYIEGEDDAILHSRIVVENQRWRWKHP